MTAEKQKPKAGSVLPALGHMNRIATPRRMIAWRIETPRRIFTVLSIAARRAADRLRYGGRRSAQIDASARNTNG